MNPEICTFLDWDTSFFARRIARLNPRRLDAETLAAAEAWCAEQSIDCLYFQADSDDPSTIQLAQQHAFQLVEVRLVFERSLKDWDPETRPRASDEVVIRPARPEDIPAVQAIAQNSYVDSRYYFDPHFAESHWQAYYRTWVKNSLEGRAEMCLAAERAGQVVGYITGVPSADRSEMMYELTGVDPVERRSGVGQELFRSGMDWCRRRGIESIWLATQGRNIATQRMVQRNGFLTRACSLYYHRWFHPAHLASPEKK